MDGSSTSSISSSSSSSSSSTSSSSSSSSRSRSVTTILPSQEASGSIIGALVECPVRWRGPAEVSLASRIVVAVRKTPQSR